jgi:Family of unknown function (DUF6178)
MRAGATEGSRRRDPTPREEGEPMATQDKALQDLRAIRGALEQAQGKRKLDLILSAPDPKALVRALPPQDLYLTILDIGLDDCAELVAMSTPAQFIHCIDAGSWPKRDAPPDPRKVLKWLALARQGQMTGESTERRFREKLAALDAELLSLLLRLELRVHDLNADDPEPDTAPGSSWTSPDRRYLVEIREDGAGYATLKRLLDDLAEEDPFLLSRLLEAIRWDVPTELEETARRWRNGRLRDVGVPEFEEALGFIARPHKAKAPAAPPAAAPGTALEATASLRPLLERAAARLSGEELDVAEQASAYAANALLVAFGTPLDDAFEVRRVLGDARALLSLGLELISGGDEQAAAQALAAQPIREIFQAAMAQLYRLQARARAAAKGTRLPQSQSATLLDPPHALLFDALAGTPPAIDGLDPQRGRPSRRRAPGSVREIALCDALLEEAEALPALLAGLGLLPEAIEEAAGRANLSASAVRASDLVRALALAAQAHPKGEAAPVLSLEQLPERGTALPEGFAAALEALLARAVAAVPEEKRPAAARLARVLRDRAGA